MGGFAPEFHCSHNFREQIALLMPVECVGPTVCVERIFTNVCQPGLASFDALNPGEDTAAAWGAMDSFLEGGGVGFFHTHPLFYFGWSEQDIRTQNGIAKAHGPRRVWHGVQPVGYDKSLFVCCWMEQGRIFRFNCTVLDDLSVAEIFLPPLPKISWANGGYEINT